jgi:ribonuclease BN (tRNA processing enzyme)
MIFTVLATGSDGNAYLLESGGKTLIIEAGKGTYKKILVAVEDVSKVVGVIYSHLHSDHFGDVEKLAKVVEVLKFENERYEDELFIIKRFQVWHNVECFGFAIFSKEEKKTMVFITDFAKVIEKSVYGLKVDFLAIELSYNSMIYSTLSPEQKIGLEYHCSDFQSIGIMRKLFDNNRNMKAVTIHKSDRACNYALTNRALYKNFGLRAEIASVGRRYQF